jgi:hypothetical protein
MSVKPMSAEAHHRFEVVGKCIETFSYSVLPISTIVIMVIGVIRIIVGV